MDASTPTRTSPPLHPRQVVYQLLLQIANNDPSVRVVELHNTEVDFQRLSQALEANNHVLHLIIQDCWWNQSIKGLRHLFHGIACNRSITILNFSENPISQFGGKLLQVALQNHPSITKLVLNRCNLMDDGVRELAKVPLGKLQELEIRQNMIQHESGKVLRQLLELNRSLMRLILSRNPIQGEGCGEMLQTGLHSLRELRLSGCSLEKGTSSSNWHEVMAKSLAMPECCLETLDLSCNGLDENAIISLATGISQNQSLQTICLSNNKIMNRGASAIALALRKRKGCLRRLTLDVSKIGDEGAIDIFQSANVCGLHCLSLRHNPITSDAANVLIESMEKTNFVVKQIELHGTRIRFDLRNLIGFWTSANRAERQKLLAPDTSPTFPLFLWPHLFYKVRNQPALLNYFLRQKVHTLIRK